MSPLKYTHIKIKNIGKVVTGKTPPTADKSNYNGDFMFISPTELHDGFMINKSGKTITKKGMNSIKSNTISGTSVLVGCIGWDIGNIGLCKDNCATNQQINSITDFKKTINPYYCYYWFTTKKEYLFSISSITRTPILSKTTFEEIEIPFPSKERQDAIVNTLQPIDQKIQNNKKIIAELEEMAKTVYDYWFTQFDFPNDEGKPYKSSGGKMVYNAELKRDIPEGWEVKSMSEILVKNNVGFDYKSIEPTVDLSVMPSGTIVINNLNESSNFSTNLFKMEKGDILFGSIRPYLKKACIAPCDGVVAGTVHSYKVKRKEDYNFALFTMARDVFFEYAVKLSTGTKMPVISNENILQYKIPYNKKIVTSFNALNIKELICNSIQDNLGLTSLRDWLLPMLMNGQAVVEDDSDNTISFNEEQKTDDEKFEHWIKNQGLAARGDVDKVTLRELFNAMDDDDK